MYDIVCQYLIDITNLLIPLIFIRMIFETFRSFVFGGNN